MGGVRPDFQVCHGVCSMFGAQLVQKTTVLWGDDKKKAVKANPWVSISR